MNPATDKIDQPCMGSGIAPSRGSNTRRREILSAAEQCFSSKGFHRATIADIGRLAGVNPGHIYYYFENKEEIVAAVVEAELEAVFELHEAESDEQSILDAVVERSGDAAVYHARRGNFRLWLEILAESGRNRTIADTVRRLDERVRERACGMLRVLNKRLSGEALESRISVQYELLSALIAGFAVRAAVGIRTDERLLRAEVMDAVRRLLRQESNRFMAIEDRRPGPKAS